MNVERVLVQLGGLGEGDQRLVLAHLLDKSLTQRHLQAELLEKGYFKWDFFEGEGGPRLATTAAAAAPAAAAPFMSSSGLPSPVLPPPPSLPASPKHKSAAAIYATVRSPRPPPPLVITGSLREPPQRPPTDDRIAAIKAVWKAFNTSDEITEIEERAQTSQVKHSLISYFWLTPPPTRVVHCFDLFFFSSSFSYHLSIFLVGLRLFLAAGAEAGPGMRDAFDALPLHSAGAGPRG